MVAEDVIVGFSHRMPFMFGLDGVLKKLSKKSPPEIIGFENISRLNVGDEVKKVKTIITRTYESRFRNFFSRNKSSINVDVLLAIFFNVGKRMLLNTK